MKVNPINEEKVKQDLKTCSRLVKDYIKDLENDIERKQHIINKALSKIKEQAKQLSIHSVVGQSEQLVCTLNNEKGNCGCDKKNIVCVKKGYGDAN